MFAEINPKDANDAGFRNGEYIWVGVAHQAARLKVRAQVTQRVAPGTVFLPFHFSGLVAGRRRSNTLRVRPVVRGGRSTPPRPTATTR